MYDTYIPSARKLLSEQKQRNNIILVLMAITLILLFGLMVLMVRGVPGSTPFVYGGKSIPPQLVLIGCLLVIVICAVPIFIWSNPRFGLLLLFTATTFIDMDPRALNTQKLTAYLPFFININNAADQYNIPGLSGLKFSVAETLIFITLICWLVRTVGHREWRFVAGPFLPILLLYAATTMLGFANGYITGGDPTMALWEVRAQFYPLIMYLMTMQLVTKREHMMRFLWIAVVGLGVLAVVGVISYLQLGGVVSEQGILDHEDSLILNIAIFLLMFNYLGGGNKKILRTGLMFLPATIFTLLENQRRAGIAAFAIAFLASLPMMWVMFTEKRKLIRRFIILFAIGGTVYLMAGWNAPGAWALPARAIRSNFSPSERDAGSDAYRQLEDADLKYTRDRSPVIGWGFGKPFIQIFPLPMVSTNFLSYFAHDSVLWLWMCTGHVGFSAFILFIATILIRGIQICKETPDKDMRNIGLLAVIFVVMAYMYGKYDLQLANYRTMMMFGIWIGLLGKLPLITKGEEETIAKPIPVDVALSAPSFLEGDTL